MLEEDDEFEDFPVEGMRYLDEDKSHGRPQADILCSDWSQEDTEVPGGTTHLWEESWDDDDENEDFSKQLKYVCKIFQVLRPPHQILTFWPGRS